MKPYQALLIDVDGTLVKKDRSLSPAVVDAIVRARRAGLEISLSTGRAFVTLGAIFDRIGWEGTHIVAGGAQVVNAATKQIIWGKSINHEDVVWLRREIERLGGEVIIVKTDALYVYNQLIEHFIYHPWKIPAKSLDQLPADWSTPLISVHQVSPELANFLQHQTKFHAVNMTSPEGKTYYDVTANGVTKKEGLHAWHDYLHIPLNLVAAVGDGLNDLELMSTIGLSVAMGNAAPEMKKIAKMEVATNEQDGVVEIINWLLA